MLAWRVILRLLEKSSDEVRPRYSQFLESRGHISHLLSNIFKLLPRGTGQLELVFAAPLLEVGADTCSTELQQLAALCWTQVDINQNYNLNTDHCPLSMNVGKLKSKHHEH